MKRIIKIAALSLIFLAAAQVTEAQKKDTDKVGKEIKEAGKATGKGIKKAGKATGKAVSKGAKAIGKSAKAVGKKTAEVSSKGYAEVKDKALKNVKGPNGETVYINRYNQKYYVDKNGRWIYMD